MPFDLREIVDTELDFIPNAQIIHLTFMIVEVFALALSIS
jgi:hypothetical protein